MAQPGVAPPEPPDDSTRVRMTVDGEVFDIWCRTNRPGEYHYDWVSGPHPGYGFSLSGPRSWSASHDDHKRAISNFLAQINPESGYLD